MDRPELQLVLGAWRRPSLKFSGPRWWSSMFLQLLLREQSSVVRDSASLASLQHRRCHPLCRDQLFLQARAICDWGSLIASGGIPSPSAGSGCAF
ncbi:hypothetical protein NDU88_003145 [Pleurodeles waltl]|uniref:Uncharacterized protein n=1 Tax=Pleurodeles waltl TaxID=8319 RepID=A0AAV7LR97_PLEWA|nr:hypothetical protein NDU88_003145 [Pleurodeles waltl]